MIRRITFGTVLFAILLLGCDSIVGLFDDEPEHWAHSSAGYPFTAYYIGGYHARYTSDGWEMLSQDFPEPEGLREGTQAALIRWSKVLAATPVPAAPSVSPTSNECGWGGKPLAPPGGSFGPGFHVFLYVGNGMFETNTTPTMAWYAYEGCIGRVAGLPSSGNIGLDADADWSDADRTEAVVAHEIGHALGFRQPFNRERAMALASSRASSYLRPTRLPIDGQHWESCMGRDIMVGGGRGTDRRHYDRRHDSRLAVRAG